MKKRLKPWVRGAKLVLKSIIVKLALAALVAVPVMWCWNYLAAIHGLPDMKFMHSLILLILLKLLTVHNIKGL